MQSKVGSGTTRTVAVLTVDVAVEVVARVLVEARVAQTWRHGAAHGQVTHRARKRRLVALRLTREGQEITAYRFRLDDQGDLVPGSVHNLQRPLRNWKKR